MKRVAGPLLVVFALGGMLWWLLASPTTYTQFEGEENVSDFPEPRPRDDSPAASTRPVPPTAPKTPIPAPPPSAGPGPGQRYVEGRVVGPDGAGIERIAIAEDPPHKKDPEERARTPLANSGVGGRFAVWVAPGVDWLGVAPDGGWLPGEAAYLPATKGEVVLRLVRARRVQGVVLDLQGRPVPAARVIVFRDSAGRSPEGIAPNTGLDGRFTVGISTAARPVHFAALLMQGLMEGAEPFAAASFSSPEALPEEVVLRLGRESMLEGIVLRPDGEPVTGGKVHGSRAGGFELRAHATRIDGRDGSFRLGNLFAGPTWVWVEPFGAEVGDSDVLLFEASSARIRITCPRAFVLRGQLQGEDTSGFVAVWTRRPRGEALRPAQEAVRVLADGTFTIPRACDGDTVLYAYRVGDDRYAWTEGLRPDVGEVEVPLHVGARIAGRVVGSDGTGVAGVTVRVDWSGPWLHFSSGEDGAFTIPGLPPGAYPVQFHAPGGTLQTSDGPVATGTSDLLLVVR